MSEVRMMEAAAAAEEDPSGGRGGGGRGAYSSPSRGSRFSVTRRSNDRRLLIEDDGLGETAAEAAGRVAATSASASYGSMPDSGSDMARPHPGKTADFAASH